ncbi:hypothetical protein FJZ19_01085 [Candidatus Pacearchaeota archaeon]|nr:hypothetical protein [Candidatus Pacearchaeota archaeon]
MAQLITGIISAIVGFITIIYMHLTISKLPRVLKQSIKTILTGLIFVHASILTMLAFNLGIITNDAQNLIVTSLLGLSAITIAIGSIKFFNIIDYIPKIFFKKIDEHSKAI